jgi:hypothetical protein
VFCIEKKDRSLQDFNKKNTYIEHSSIEIVAMSEVIPDFTLTSLELPSPGTQHYGSQEEFLSRPPPAEGREGRHGSLLL